jgi:SAM-dependent methyltransferase
MLRPRITAVDFNRINGGLVIMIFRIKELLDALLHPLYVLLGRKPWRFGYYTAKKRMICSGIDHRVLADSKALPAGYGYRIDERAVEYPWLFSQLPANPGKMLDAGSALNHGFLLERAPLARAQLTVMTLAPEKRCFWNKGVSYVFGDLRDTQFSSGTFDVIASVSTIEHIGLDNTLHYTSDVQKKENNPLGFVPAVMEFRRLLKSGGLCLITVPYGQRGVYGWYQVFDAALLAHVISVFSPTSHSVEYFAYRSDSWQRCLTTDIADAEFYDVHTDMPYDADYAAGARGVACLRMVA